MNTAEGETERRLGAESEALEARRLQVQESLAHPQNESPTTRLSQELLAAAIAGAPIALFGLDHDGVLTLADGGLLAEGEALTAVGLGLDDFSGRSILDVFPGGPGIAPGAVGGGRSAL